GESASIGGGGKITVEGGAEGSEKVAGGYARVKGDLEMHRIAREREIKRQRDENMKAGKANQPYDPTHEKAMPTEAKLRGTETEIAGLEGWFPPLPQHPPKIPHPAPTTQPAATTGAATADPRRDLAQKALS